MKLPQTIGPRAFDDVAIPFSISAQPARVAVGEYLRISASACATRFDLGRIDLTDRNTREFLTGLAKIRQRHAYGIQSHGASNSPISEGDADLLFRAGVRRIALEGMRPERHEPAELTWSNAIQLESVRRLCSAEIDVAWSLVVPSSTDRAGRDEVLRICRSAQHLPPPARLVPLGESDEALRTALADWRASHRPRTLTFARGPGFLRFLDRRGGSRDWKFVVLSGMQAELFAQCESVQSLENLAAHSGLTDQAVRRFIEELNDANLVFLSKDGWAVSLVPRRTVEEQWASGDH